MKPLLPPTVGTTRQYAWATLSDIPRSRASFSGFDVLILSRPYASSSDDTERKSEGPSDENTSAVRSFLHLCPTSWTKSRGISFASSRRTTSAVIITPV